MLCSLVNNDVYPTPYFDIQVKSIIARRNIIVAFNFVVSHRHIQATVTIPTE